jgi:ABC-2 type transport system permease protein
VYGVVALLIGVVCAVSQALSATLARSITSALLSYLVVAFLTIGTIVAFTLIVPLVADERPVTTPEGYTYIESHSRQDKVWWLLAANPFVILADSAPQVPPRRVQSGDIVYYDDYDPLSAVGRSVRNLRRPPSFDYSYSYAEEEQKQLPPVWPWGLGFNVLLGIGAVWLTTHRLKTPTRKISHGVRIA